MQLDVDALNVITLMAMGFFMLAVTFWPGNGVKTSYKIGVVVMLIFWGVMAGQEIMSGRASRDAGNAIPSASTSTLERSSEGQPTLDDDGVGSSSSGGNSSDYESQQQQQEDEYQRQQQQEDEYYRQQQEDEYQRQQQENYYNQ